jgi:hypothetical protein
MLSPSDRAAEIAWAGPIAPPGRQRSRPARAGARAVRAFPLGAAGVRQHDEAGPLGMKRVNDVQHGESRLLAVLGISESEYVTRFTSPTQTDWVMRCTARKVLRLPEDLPIKAAAKAQLAA